MTEPGGALYELREGIDKCLVLNHLFLRTIYSCRTLINSTQISHPQASTTTTKLQRHLK